MKLIKLLTFLLFVMFMSGCEAHRYLDFDAEPEEFSGYTIEAVLEANHTPKPVEIDGVKVHESYPVTLRFFLESGLDKEPILFEVQNIEIETKTSGKQITVASQSTERVNRPTAVSHNRESLTMHFVASRFSKDDLPFEDYLLRCTVKIEEESGNTLKKDLQFDFKSSIKRGSR